MEMKTISRTTTTTRTTTDNNDMRLIKRFSKKSKLLGRGRGLLPLLLQKLSIFNVMKFILFFFIFCCCNNHLKTCQSGWLSSSKKSSSSSSSKGLNNGKKGFDRKASKEEEDLEDVGSQSRNIMDYIAPWGEGKMEKDEEEQEDDIDVDGFGEQIQPEMLPLHAEEGLIYNANHASNLCKTDHQPTIVFYIMVNHGHTLRSLIHLFTALFSKQHFFIIHMDQRISDSTYQTVKNTIDDYLEFKFPGININESEEGNLLKRNIHFMRSKYREMEWYSWEHVDSIIDMMETLYNNNNNGNGIIEWDHFITLSGDTYVTLSPLALQERIRTLCKYNFMTHSDNAAGLRPTNYYEFDKTYLTRKIYKLPLFEKVISKNGILNILKADYPDLDRNHLLETTDTTTKDNDNNAEKNDLWDIIPHFGTPWMVLRQDFVFWFIKELKENEKVTLPLLMKIWCMEIEKKKDKKNNKNNNNKNNNLNMILPGEMFFPTILAWSPFRKTIPPNHLKDGMKAMTYLRMNEHWPWGQRPPIYNSPVYQPKAGPYYLGLYDLLNIKNSQALFIQKVWDEVDHNIYKLLPVDSFDDIPNITWPEEIEILSLNYSDTASEWNWNEKGCVQMGKREFCNPEHRVEIKKEF